MSDTVFCFFFPNTKTGKRRRDEQIDTQITNIVNRVNVFMDNRIVHQLQYNIILFFAGNIVEQANWPHGHGARCACVCVRVRALEPYALHTYTQRMCSHGINSSFTFTHSKIRSVPFRAFVHLLCRICLRARPGQT